MQDQSTTVRRRGRKAHPRVERICPQCQQPFMVRATLAQTYCTYACRNRATNCQRGEYRPDVICPQCGKSFHPRKDGAKRCCSKACAVAWERANGRDGQGSKYLKPITPAIPCSICGQAFQPRNKTSHLCSEACRVEHGRRKSLEQYHQKGPTVAPCAMERRLCAECGSAYVVVTGYGAGKGAGDSRRRMYCSDTCGKRAAKRVRRARKHDAYRGEPVYRARIFARDKWTCQLCGKRTKRTAVVPDPLAPVLDHILPLALGGSHDPSNVQCAHFICNSKKGAGSGGQLRLLG